MARTYVVVAGDTMKKIAKKIYNDSSLYKKLSEYNGISNPNMIIVGQALEIPSKKVLTGAPAGPANPLVPVPHGLEEILAAFGNIYDYITEDGRVSAAWEAEHFSRAKLPFSIPLSWDKTVEVGRLYCNSRLTGIMGDVFRAIEREGLKGQVRTFGGCYNFRGKRSSHKLSTHCWGIAIDLNPETNRMGTPGDMHPGIVDIFREFGFKWGGDWSGRSKDPMHFQYCTGY